MPAPQPAEGAGGPDLRAADDADGRRPALAAIAGAFALLLPLLFLANLAVPSWSARFALLGLEAAVGLPLAVALLRTGARPAAGLALGVAVWALLSTVLSPTPAMALWGVWLWGTGAVFVLALVGCWALGASAGSDGARLVERGLLVGVAVNVVVALVQPLVDLSRLELDPYGGRSTGLWGNPVWLAGFLVGGFWLVAARVRQHPARWAAAAMPVAAALQLSGSRAALALVVVSGVVVATVAGWRTAVVLAACTAVGFAIGGAVAEVGAAGQRATASARLVGAEEGIRPRLETWVSAGRAVADRPLAGQGPGRYGAATSPYRSLRLALDRGSDRVFLDAHNIVVEYAVTTGLPGLALLLGWLGTAVWLARGRPALLAFALGVLAMHLLEPQHVGLTPLAFLALGTAAARSWPRSPGVPVVLHAVLAAAAVVLLAVHVAGFWHFRQGTRTGDVRHLERAQARLPPWPEPLLETARALAPPEGVASPGSPVLAQVLRLHREATRRDPRDPQVWYVAGVSELAAGDVAAAEADFRRALALNPWSAHAANGLALAALRRGDRAEAVGWLQRSLRVGPQQDSVRALLREIETSA